MRAMMLWVLCAAGCAGGYYNEDVGELVEGLTSCDGNRSTTLCRSRFTLSNTLKIPYYANFKIEDANPALTRAVIVIHGQSRLPWNAFDAALGAAQIEGVQDSTIVIAPYFKTGADSPAYDEPFWTEGAWKEGGVNVPDFQRPWLSGLSSFSVIDQMIEKLANRTKFPNLRKVVIVGHSAGGQFTQRYAAGTRIDVNCPGLSYRFVPANPSSFMYLNDKRFDAATGSFVTPLAPVQQYLCPTWNTYKFGLAGRNSYMSRQSASALVTQYTARDVIYLQGTADTGTDELDMGCEANLQGSQRFERGWRHMVHLNSFFAHRHRMSSVAGVAHDSTLMYQSLEGRTAMFK
jgi:hypothetical protein